MVFARSLAATFTGMNDLRFGSLGETWINLVNRTVQSGVSVDGESLELIEVRVAFPARAEGDELIRQFGDSRMIAEMERVFFADGANAEGDRKSVV